MAIGGAAPSARDRMELYRMSAEKIAAFNESWNAMGWEIFRANQQLASSFFVSLWSPSGRPESFARLAAGQLDTMLGILEKGFAPIHRRATANAKRLGRRKRS